MLRRHRTRVSGRFQSSLLALLLGVGVITASSEWHPNADSTQWSGNEIYRILHDSPWTKTVRVSFSNNNLNRLDRDASVPNQNTNGDWTNHAGELPGQVPAAGRQRDGGYSSGGSYGSGGTRTTSTIPEAPANDRSRPTEVTVQWQSAAPVRLALSKKGGASDSDAAKEGDRYVIAIIGLPVVALGGPAATLDSDTTISPEDAQQMAERVKHSASLLRSGHEPLNPVKVEVGQGADGRVLLYFPKSDPITMHDKSVEFRLTTGHLELRKKFATKDMEFAGKLEL